MLLGLLETFLGFDSADRHALPADCIYTYNSQNTPKLRRNTFGVFYADISSEGLQTDRNNMNSAGPPPQAAGGVNIKCHIYYKKDKNK